MRSLYRSGSLTAVARKLARCKLDLVGVQEVRWDLGAWQEQGIIFFSTEKETKMVNWEQDFFVHHRIVSAVKWVEFVSDRM